MSEICYILRFNDIFIVRICKSSPRAQDMAFQCSDSGFKNFPGGGHASVTSEKVAHIWQALCEPPHFWRRSKAPGFEVAFYFNVWYVHWKSIKTQRFTLSWQSKFAPWIWMSSGWPMVLTNCLKTVNYLNGLILLAPSEKFNLFVLPQD